MLSRGCQSADIQVVTDGGRVEGYLRYNILKLRLDTVHIKKKLGVNLKVLKVLIFFWLCKICIVSMGVLLYIAY